MLTLQAAVDLWLGEHIPTTRRSYQYNMRELCDFVGPGRPLDQVSAEDLLRFAQYYRAKASVRSPATYEKLLKTLRTFFNWCIKADFIAKSPAKPLKPAKKGDSLAREKAMSDAAYNQLVDYAKWDVRGLALVLFLGDTGCRIGGAAGLRWRDIDFVADTPTALVTEKGAPPRKVFFGKSCERALLRLQAAKPGTDKVFGVNNADSLKQYFRRLCQRAGIGSYGPHSLRHRKGHQFGDNKVSPVIGAMVLGNTVDIMLKYYYAKDWDRAAAAASEFTTDVTNVPQIQRVDKGMKKKTS